MTNKHKNCYGTMFRDTLHFEVNRDLKGKVFSYKLSSIGLGRTDRTVKADISQWDDCLECPEFNFCYKFCMAQLTLESAIANR